MPSLAPILLAEDEETDVFFFKLALKKSGLEFPLVVATDGKAVIEYLGAAAEFPKGRETRFPCLLLLDLKMPCMDGFAVLAWLKAHPQVKCPTIVVLTSSADDADRDKARQLGASDYVVKPNEPGGLVEIIHNLRDRWLGDAIEPPEGD